MLAQKSEKLDGIIVDSKELVGLSAQARDIKLENRAKSHGIMDGASKSSRRGRGMEFAEVRHYQPGDDIRNIDWRVTARTQETYTKLFQEEKERPVYLLVDQRNSMFFGSQSQFKSVLAARLAAIIAWAAYKNGDKLGTLVFNQSQQSDLRPKQGKNTLFHFFHELTEFNQTLFQEKRQATEKTESELNQPEHGLSDMVQELQRVARPGSLIFILSDFHDFTEETSKALSILTRHNDIELLQCFDPFESSLPKMTQLPISNGHQRLTLNSASKQFSKRYSDQWKAHQQALRTKTMRLGIQLKTLSTHDNLNKHLSTVFNIRTGKKS